MTGTATVTVKIDVTGIGDDVTVSNSTDMTVPAEVMSGYTVVETATTDAIQLFTDTTKIDLDKIYGVYLKAESGTIYIIVNTADTTTFDSDTADFVLNEGEACYLPINPDANDGLAIDAAAVTDAFSWVILGKA